MKSYYTSFYQPGSIYLRFDRNFLIFENIYLPPKSKTILLEIHQFENSNCVFSKIIDLKEDNKIELNLHIQDVYFIQIYTESNIKNYYNGLIFKRDIPFIFNGHYFSFINTIVFPNNFKFLKTLTKDLVPLCKRDDKIIQHAVIITKLANSIYSKVLKIHDWVANEFYYDEDGLNSGEYLSSDYSFPSLMLSKKCVCQGYANISALLLNSIGIPSIIIQCFALGISTSGGWDKPENLKSPSNHVIVASYCENRWVLFDPTWDSPNKYKNGKYITAGKLSHKYFDITPHFLSSTHRLISTQKNF